MPTSSSQGLTAAGVRNPAVTSEFGDDRAVGASEELGQLRHGDHRMHAEHRLFRDRAHRDVHANSVARRVRGLRTLPIYFEGTVAA